MVKKYIFASMVFLLVLAFASAEISVNQDSHSFVVNTLPSSPYPQIQPSQPGMSIIIQPLTPARTIEPCGQANFSFKITNQNSVQKLYSFKLKDFEGTAFITSNLMLNPKETKIVGLSLIPECSGTAVLNPKVHVETDDEEADIPFIINIEGIYIEPDDCNYYYDDNICKSPYYIRIINGGSYSIDLSKWFHDPDNDKLQYSFTKSSNVDIAINKNKAKITPRKGWLGTEEIVFYASDGKGGKAESKTFYIHSVEGKLLFLDQLLEILGF